MATVIAPSGCHSCGLPERGHGQRWNQSTRWHRWEAPSMAKRKERMVDRALHDHVKALTGSRWAQDRGDAQILTRLIALRDELRSGTRQPVVHIFYDASMASMQASHTTSERGRRALEHLAAELRSHIPTPENVAAAAEEIRALDREGEVDLARARLTLLWHEVFDLIKVGHGDPAAYAAAAQAAYGVNAEWQVLSTLGETE